MMLARWVALMVVAVVLATARSSAAGNLKQVVSREHPLFDVAASRLAAGRDGYVYLSSYHYVLRVKPDGSEKRGDELTYANNRAVANAAGVLATANAHFVHSVKFWDKDLRSIGAVDTFLVSNAVEWWAPYDVEAGSGGDFYALDQNRNRVERLAAPARTVAIYPLDRIGEDLSNKMPELRVWEGGQQFYILADSVLRVVSFDGEPRWKLDVPVIARVSDHRGGFDVDDGGNLFMLGESDDVVRVYDSLGAQRGALHLAMGTHRGPVSDIRVMGGSVLVKTTNPSELFQVYDRATGALKRIVASAAEELDITLPDDPWAAGDPLPITIRLSTRGPVRPRWRAWMRPLGTPEFREVSLGEGTFTPPPDAAGVYQFRVSSGLEGAKGDYWVDKVVEVRGRDSHGSLSIWSPLNRIYFGEGESIPIHVLARSSEPARLPQHVVMRLLRDGHPVARADVELGPLASTDLVLPPDLTRALPPGRYLLTAEVPGLTVAGQVLEIGPGLTEIPTFSLVQHGDYVASHPSGSLFDLPDKVAARLSTSRTVGVNMFVDRLNRTLVDERTEATAMATRLARDPSGIAPEKTMLEGAGLGTIGGYGAFGIEQRAILLNMDAGLPIGTGWDHRTVPELVDVVTHITSGLSTYPAFRGWSWAANWWAPTGNAAASGDAEKAAYDAARARALSTGAWDQVLDTVSDRMLSYAVDAERRFRSALDAVARGKLSVMTGPYRAPGVLPPVSFRRADEVDLHYQSEQIQPPIVTADNVDFYKRPGKRAWGHPELWNDDGTGGMILPTLFAMVMRGADGVGWSGDPPWWRTSPSDSRASGGGILSILRSVDRLLLDYGPWLTALHAADPVAIAVSSRMMRIDQWAGSYSGEYFGRLYEAYGAALYAHRPASFVFTEDLEPDALQSFQAVLIVGQRVAIDPPLLEALTRAKARGATVAYDGTCRPDLVASFTPLGESFDHISHDPSVWQDDSAHLRVATYFKNGADGLSHVLGSTVRPVAGVDEPAVLLTERTAARGRFVWAVNNVEPDLDPALAWRTSLIMSQRMPLSLPLHLDLRRNDAVYDIFALREVSPVDGTVDADLRSLPARLFAILPARIDAVRLTIPGRIAPGQDFAWNIAVTDDSGHSIETDVPVKLELRNSVGLLLKAEVQTTHGSVSATGRWTLPIGEPSGPWSLRAQELFSGKTATASIAVAQPEGVQDMLVMSPPHLHWDSGQLVRVEGRGVEGSLAIESSFGPHLKEIAVSADGKLGALNAMNWDENLYGIDLLTGGIRWRQRLGNHFVYAPSPSGSGFAVEAFDRTTAEGYQLYQLDGDGRPQRRFAGYGLTKRATNWAYGSVIADPNDAFATSPDGDWVASAGDLGLIVWDRSGRRRWGVDWWRDARRRIALVTLNRDIIVALEGRVATAYDAWGGDVKWSVVVAETGTILGAVAAADGRTIAVRTDSQGGRVFIVRSGKVLNTITSAADDAELSNDGAGLAVTTGADLKWYDVASGVTWTFTGDGAMLHPRISADGSRVVVGSELGTLYVLGASGGLLWRHDCKSLPIGTWLRDGDLLFATWMGNVERVDSRYKTVWSTHIEPSARDVRPQLLSTSDVPTIRAAAWGNAAIRPALLVPNLLTQTHARVFTSLGDKPQAWLSPASALFDGKPEASANPLLAWTTIENIDSGWYGDLSLEIDVSPKRLRVTGVTLVEDPTHPESWLRDMRMESWDERLGRWRPGPFLLSNSAVHTHWFGTPVDGSRFRFISTGGGAWPSGNVRLGELVFHGTVLPDTKIPARARASER